MVLLPILKKRLHRLMHKKPSPAGEGWVTTVWMQEVEQRREQLPRGNQNRERCLFESPHPNLLPQGEGANSLIFEL